MAVAAVILAAAAGAALLARKAVPEASDDEEGAVRALGAGAAVLCLSVTLDSAIEHYRGRFHNRMMFAGPTFAAAGLAAATYVALRPADAPSPTAKLAFGSIAAAGTLGLGFHAYNIARRPGHVGELNLFYAAPAGAPAALVIAAVFGLCAARIAAVPGLARETARYAASAVAAGIVGTVAEAGLLHFRGAFQNPAMYAPVTIPPLAAAATAVAIAAPSAAGVAGPLLRATAVLGIAGPMFHAYGVHRNMGGWRNWSQMLLQGPPIPAPPAFLGISIAGLGLLPLLEGERE